MNPTTLKRSLHQWRPVRIAAFAVVLVAGLISLARPAVADGPVIYDAFPDGVTGNVPSLGFEATSTSEFGDHIAFAGSQRSLESATVMMSSWGCESGAWHTGNCVTTPGATFEHTITLTFYEVVDQSGTPTAGDVIASVTQTFSIPYRPSADTVNCSGGPWYSEEEDACFNGLATPITFDFNGEPLPEQVIWGIAYNTTHYGAVPMGADASCYTEDGGCGYDSLNVGLWSFDPIVGTDVEEDATFANSTWAAFYCDGGTAGTGAFRYDYGVGCWAGYRPLIRVTAELPLVGPPTTADQCKKDGWMTFNNPTFENQGDCVSYVATGGKNLGTGTP